MNKGVEMSLKNNSLNLPGGKLRLILKAFED